MFPAAVFSLFLLGPPVLEKIAIDNLWSEKNNKVVIKDLNGNEFKWGDFKGKVLIVNIWATWCPYCVDELPSLARLYKKFADNSDVLLLCYSDEDYATLKRFNDRKKPGVPICYGKSGIFPLSEHNKKHNGGVIPVTYIIGKDGKEIYQSIGAADWDDKKVAVLIDELRIADFKNGR